MPKGKEEGKIKIIILGDIAVGKTSLLVRYAEKKFDPATVASASFDFKEPEVMIDNQPVRVRIWDTAGQERFRTITTSFYRGATGVILAYDVTNLQSFQNLQGWIGDINKYAQNGAKKLLIGCKADNDCNRKVEAGEGQEFADNHQMDYFRETSSKDNINVNETFQFFIQSIYDEIKSEDGGDVNNNGGNVFKLKAVSGNEKKGCGC